MKSCFAAVILSFVSAVAFGADVAPQSVLQQQPTLATEAGTIAADATAPAAAASSAPACADCACSNGTCTARGGRSRYRIVTEECDACTGRSVRSVTRGVVRGGAAVVQSAGAVVCDVATLPVRAVRRARCAGRCGSCCR